MRRKDPHKGKTLASISVIVMLAMAPIAEGKEPAQFVPVNSEPLTELVDQANSTEPKAYEYAQTQQDELIQRVPNLKSDKIQKIIDCTGNKQKGKLVFTTSKGDTSSTVWSVYYIQNDYKGNKNLKPPSITKIIYHDSGEDSFLGILIQEEIMAKNNTIKCLIREVRLDDKSAQYLIDFVAGDTNFKNYSGIKFEETKKTNLKALQILDY
jgi:hypothetical protein